MHPPAENHSLTDRRLTADPESVIALTARFVQRSPIYRALDWSGRDGTDAAVARATTPLTNVGPQVAPALKSRIVDGYKDDVGTLVRRGWLTPAQAALLGILADVL